MASTKTKVCGTSKRHKAASSAFSLDLSDTWCLQQLEIDDSCVTAGSPDIMMGMVLMQKLKLCSKTDQEIFSLIGRGKSAVDVAAEMGMTESAVMERVQGVYNKVMGR